MATRQMSAVIEHLRRSVLLREAAGLTDAQLLENFIDRGDEAAIATLVCRHGPMVWGVCSRVLANHHDAEDAFQATFLVLVRRARSIASRDLLANWLYGVAHQTALKARATVARRKGRERQVMQMPDPAATKPTLWSDLQPVLDEVLSGLPDRYRSVIVLCDLQGKTRKEAARQLGVPEGTVAGWVARARVMLAKRLSQRGVTLSGGALAMILTHNVAAAAVPATVMANTIKAAGLSAAGHAAATGLISAKVAALAEGVVRTMFLSKIKCVLTVILAIGLAVGGLGTGLNLSTDAAAQQPQAKSDDAIRADVQQAEADLERAKLAHEQAKRQLDLARARLETVKAHLQKANAVSSTKGANDRKDSLAGEWTLIAKEHDGKLESYPQGVGVTLALGGGKFLLITQALNPMGGLGSGLMTETFYKHDPRNRTFDLVYPQPPKSQARRLGIYKLEGDKLTICWGKVAGGDAAASDRPTELATKPGSGRTLNVFTRVRPDNASRGSAPQQRQIETVLGPKAFRDGDVIEITDVQATSAKLEQGDSITVRGRVRLASHDQAQLGLYLTQTEQNAPTDTDRAQTTEVKKGRSDFELKLTIAQRGVLHLTFYDKSGRPFGGVYFGTALQMKQIDNWSLDYYLTGEGQPSSNRAKRP